MMKHGIGALAAAAILSVASFAKADEFAPQAVCREAYGSNQADIDVNGIHNASTSSQMAVLCPLKRVTCAGNCTYSLDFYSVDFNSTDALDSNVTCNLEIQTKNQAGFNYHGAAQANTGTVSSMVLRTVSLTTNAVLDGWIFLQCTIGKNGAGGNSYIAWIGNTSGI